ncbi:MAG: sugar phosphate isomerase/epimerase family protein [Desulfopila sp.]
MHKEYSLAHLTVLGCSPAEMTYIAGRTGYDFVSFRLIPMGVEGEYDFQPSDRQQVRQTRAALTETGVRLLDLELARIIADHDPRDYVPAMEVAAELGARHMIASAWPGDRDDLDFIIDRYAEICDLAKPLGLTVDLEFPTFSLLTSLPEAVAVLRGSQRPNSGLLVDTLYCHFSRIDPHQLAALPADWFHLLHICDSVAAIPGEKAGLMHAARDERLYVGEGGIDFQAILAAIPPVPLSIELPHLARVKELGYEEHARRCLATAKQHLAPYPFRPLQQGVSGISCWNL